MQQIKNFYQEAQQLRQLLVAQPIETFAQGTGFKDWMVHDVIRHLYCWNKAAEFSALGADELKSYLEQAVPCVMVHGIRSFERQWSADIQDKDLLDVWWQSCERLVEVFNGIDPKARLKWAGPDMSARSSITARLMETWSHGQALYDLYGVKRQNGPGLKDIADLGVRTFGWTFINRKLPVPEPMPFIELTGPGGELWQWNSDGSDSADYLTHGNSVKGSAEEFCLVVAQSRNVEDTALEVKGEVAEKWMAIAQCFAGPPENPPEVGSRV